MKEVLDLRGEQEDGDGEDQRDPEATSEVRHHHLVMARPPGCHVVVARAVVAHLVVAGALIGGAAMAALL